MSEEAPTKQDTDTVSAAVEDNDDGVIIASSENNSQLDERELAGGLAAEAEAPSEEDASAEIKGTTEPQPIQVESGDPNSFSAVAPAPADSGAEAAEWEQGDDGDIAKRCFIGGLSRQSTEESLRSFFMQYGRVTSVKIQRDPHTRLSRCFGFMTFATVDEANKVAGQRFTVDGKEMEVKPALKREQTADSSSGGLKMFVGGLPHEVEEDRLHSFFSQHGPVQEVKIMREGPGGRHRGFGFVTMQRPTDVNYLVDLQFVDIDGKKVQIKRAERKGQVGMGPGGGYGGRGGGYGAPPGYPPRGGVPYGGGYGGPQGGYYPPNQPYGGHPGGYAPSGGQYGGPPPGSDPYASDPYYGSYSSVQAPAQGGAPRGGYQDGGQSSFPGSYQSGGGYNKASGNYGASEGYGASSAYGTAESSYSSAYGAAPASAGDGSYGAYGQTQQYSGTYDSSQGGYAPEGGAGPQRRQPGYAKQRYNPY